MLDKSVELWYLVLGERSDNAERQKHFRAQHSGRPPVASLSRLALRLGGCLHFGRREMIHVFKCRSCGRRQRVPAAEVGPDLSRVTRIDSAQNYLENDARVCSACGSPDWQVFSGSRELANNFGR